MRNCPTTDQSIPATDSAGIFHFGTHRHTFPVRLSPEGCSFQFGRTSILFPRLPHLAHFTRERNHGTSVSAARHVDQALMPAGVNEAERIPPILVEPWRSHFRNAGDGMHDFVLARYTALADVSLKVPGGVQ